MADFKVSGEGTGSELMLVLSQEWSRGYNRRWAGLG